MRVGAHSHGILPEIPTNSRSPSLPVRNLQVRWWRGVRMRSIFGYNRIDRFRSIHYDLVERATFLGVVLVYSSIIPRSQNSNTNHLNDALRRLRLRSIVKDGSHDCEILNRFRELQ
ncbi:hypothetical protein B296_00004853 [Ensete ventricosum]|uniref:Uncharacterized protein n=1 Tax=Ensete ventricosum TaxID=4639 RepID=A0A427AP24_ENSVE|nr:hypothetical protein B296_00004853 [Ensete ventricosum]